MRPEDKQPSTADVIDLERHRAARGTQYEEATSTDDLVKAAEQGDADAQTLLGVCYSKGEEAPQSDEEAIKWWRKAAEQNHPLAQCSLGFCYMLGAGVRKNMATAVAWWRKAAAQGSSLGQGALGIAYMHGNGVDKDCREAYILFSLALADRDRLPPEIVDDILPARDACLELLDAGQLKQAQEEAGHRWSIRIKERDRPSASR